MTARHLPNVDINPFWVSVENLVRSLPPEVAGQQRLSNQHQFLIDDVDPRVLTAKVLAGLAVLQRIRQLTVHPLLLLKGFQVASLYPQLWMRDTGDVDILTTEPDDVYLDLIAGGFKAFNSPVVKSHHQLPPLWNQEFNVSVEVHRRPNTGQFAQFLTPHEVFARSTESRVRLDGILGPSLEHDFALHLAHSWSDRPVGRARDLIDLTLLANALPDNATEVARRYRLKRVWVASMQARDALLNNQSPSLALRLVTRHLTRPYDSQHDVYRRLASPLWADSPLLGYTVLRRELERAAHGNPGETILHKLKRSMR